MQDINSALPVKWQSVTGDPYRNNIAIRVIPNVCSIQGRVKWLYDYATDEENQTRNILVFVTRIDQGEKYKAELQKMDLTVDFYHAKLDPTLKAELERKFREGETRILLTTTALGLGYDKKDIRDVVHMHSPLSLVQYYQEFGRAGRDGAPARAILLPSKLWEPMGWLNALQKIVSILKQSNYKEEKEGLENMCLQNRFRESDITDAFCFGLKKQILQMNRTAVVLADEGKFLSEQLWGQQRCAELSVMDELNKNPACCWRFILKQFGKSVDDDWKCGTCSGSDCDPGGDVRTDPFAGEEYCYRCVTRGGLVVYGLCEAGEDLDLDIDRIKAIVENHIPELIKDPPKWTLTYVPDSTGANEMTFKSIAEALGNMEQADYITSDPSKEKMRGANNETARKAVIDSEKFSFNRQKMPQSGNVIIYDDCMVSGTTLDHVVKPLQARGLHVTAIVHRIYPFEQRKLDKIHLFNEEISNDNNNY
mmetsp:Transcript_18358/g.25726  ORF Transcript_18358/g.25726 Transcript_18358/m.25726 type:complete len:479 (+) Transcript_18358:451-1887(+)